MINLSKLSFENILNGLKKRLDDNNTLTVQSEDGYLFNMSFTFNNPVDSDALKLHNHLPKDYINFLQTHNGADFFSWEYGTLFSIFSLKKALLAHEKVKSGEYVPSEFSNDWFPIGHVEDIGHLYIDFSSDKNYLVLAGIPYIALFCDFATWLDRMIRVNGERYWEWASKEF